MPSLTKKHRGPRFGIVSFLDSTLDPWRMQSETQKETSTLEINGTLNMEYNESIEHFLEFPEPNELLVLSIQMHSVFNLLVRSPP